MFTLFYTNLHGYPFLSLGFPDGILKIIKAIRSEAIEQREGLDCQDRNKQSMKVVKHYEKVGGYRAQLGLE